MIRDMLMKQNAGDMERKSLKKSFKGVCGTGFKSKKRSGRNESRME